MTENEIQAYLRIFDMGGEASDVTLLTLLLNGISPVYNSEDAARELIDRYGTLYDACDAPWRFFIKHKGCRLRGCKAS